MSYQNRSKICGYLAIEISRSYQWRVKISKISSKKSLTCKTCKSFPEYINAGHELTEFLKINP